MASILFKKEMVHTIGNLPQKGDIAPDFTLVSKILEDKTLEDFKNKKKILNIFPSLDTGVCSKSIHAFYKKVASMEGLVLLNISLDLPFAAARFCSTEDLPIIHLSAFRSTFPREYGLLMTDGPLAGLLARAVLVLDESNRVLYQELVSEITHEPNYQSALDSCLNN
jgi:thiol peroxidase